MLSLRCWTSDVIGYVPRMLSDRHIHVAGLSQIFGWSKKMSAIALLDVSGADSAFAELVGLGRAAAGQWAAEHPGAPTPARATAAPLPQVCNRLGKAKFVGAGIAQPGA